MQDDTRDQVDTNTAACLPKYQMMGAVYLVCGHGRDGKGAVKWLLMKTSYLQLHFCREVEDMQPLYR